MQPPAKPANEAERLKTLQSLGVLDTPPEERFDRLTRVAKRALGVPIALVSLIDSDRQWFKSCQGLTATETHRDISFCGHAIHEEGVFIVEDASRDERFHDNPLVSGEPLIRFYAGCPLSAPDGSKVGTLCVIDTESRRFDEADTAILIDLAHMVERELAAVSMAINDELTGLANRCGFEALAHNALQQCRRAKLPACMLFFDLDRFKDINDSLGHETGDRALRDFAGMLRQAFRDSDVLGRISGDEFAVLTTGADRDRVEAALNRLQDMFGQHSAEGNTPYKILFSVGVAEFDPQRPRDVAELLAEADALMYKQKNQRRQPGAAR